MAQKLTSGLVCNHNFIERKLNSIFRWNTFHVQMLLYECMWDFSKTWEQRISPN